MRVTLRAVVMVSVIVLSAVSPAVAQETDGTDAEPAIPTAEDFGYGSMMVGDGPARGVRPLLVVVVESPPAANKSGVSHTPSYYDRLLFGYGDTALPGGSSGRKVSVNELYIENSRGRFSWTKAGGKIYGPITYPRNELFVSKGGFGDDGGEFDTREAAPHLAAARGFDFSRYDRDENGKVEADELGILVIDDRSNFGGQTIDICERVETPDSGKIKVCTKAAGVGHRASLSVISHELGHMLGAYHFYGADLHLKSRTIMGPSTGPDNLWTFHFDPWTKIQLGWARPRVYTIPELAATGTCAFTGDLGSRGLLSDRDTRSPIILYDPERYDPASRTGEYYIIEYRRPTSYDSDLQGTGQFGLAIWYVETEEGIPKSYPALIKPDGKSTADSGDLDSTPAGDDIMRDDRIYPGPDGIINTTVPRGPDGEALDSSPIPTDVMNFLVAPGAPEKGAPKNYSQRGNYPFWNRTSGPARLRWWDDTYVGFPLEFELLLAGPVVNLNTREMHITLPARRMTAEPGGTLILDGHFVPESSESVVRLTRGGEIVAELDRGYPGVRLWTCNELDVILPSDLDYGTYGLYAVDPSTGARSGEILLSVREDVDYGSWFGTYEGRVDGREAALTIEPASEFDYAIELRDSEQGVTYQGTTPGSTTNVLRNVPLGAADGQTLTIDSLYLQSENRVSGHTEWRHEDYGLAFSTDGTAWEPTGQGLASSRDAWSRQWVGTFEGYLDDEEAELRVLESEFAGLGYVYDVELESSEGVIYRGQGSVLLDSPHVMRFGRSLENTTTFSVERPESDLGTTSIPGSSGDATAVVDSVRVPRLLLHTWDTDYVSGSVASDRYGSQAEGAYFVRQSKAVPLAVRNLVANYNANAESVPETARSVFGNQRIDLVVTSTAHPISPADTEDVPSRVRTESQAVYGLVMGDPEIESVTAGNLSNPTMTVRIKRTHLDAIVESDDPGRVFVDYYRTGVLEVEPVGWGDRITLGMGTIVSNLAKRFGSEDARYPSPAVERLARLGGASRNAGLIRQRRVVQIAAETRVDERTRLGGVKATLRDTGDGTGRNLQMMRSGAGIVDAVRAR